MGRKRMADGRRVVVGVRLSEGTAALLDEARGDVSRSAWAEAAIMDRLAEAPLPVTGKRAAPVRVPPPKAAKVPAGLVAEPVFREPRSAAVESCPHRNWDRYCGSCGRLNDAKGMPAG